MSKTSKFLICENPLTDDKRLFILHTRTPMVLAEVLHFEPENEDDYLQAQRTEEGIFATVDYPGELVLLRTIAFYQDKIWSQQAADKYAKLMKRMGDWYHAYLKWEDENIANEY